VVICGAGLAGLSSAYFLTHKYNFKNVTIIDALPPMSFTSSKSTECYRNYWLDRTMLDFVTDSIKYMETWTREYDNPFDMNRRGYVFLTNKKENNYSEEAKYAQSIGLGEARVHTKNLKNYRKSDPETVDPNLDVFICQFDDWMSFSVNSYLLAPEGNGYHSRTRTHSRSVSVCKFQRCEYETRAEVWVGKCKEIGPISH
jgi:hypothetical protein